jgi:hypothetical protein
MKSSVGNRKVVFLCRVDVACFRGEEEGGEDPPLEESDDHLDLGLGAEGMSCRSHVTGEHFANLQVAHRGMLLA